jgi:hypothetical protein
MVSAFQSGSATIALGGSSIAVANTAVLASTIVMVTASGVAPDATATSFSVEVVAGTGFTIHSNAAATAATVLKWFVARY